MNLKYIFKKYQVSILVINIISILIFLKMLNDVLKIESLFVLDTWISTNIINLWNPILNNIMIVITNFASTIFVVIFSFFMFLYLYFKKDKFEGYFYLSNITLGLVLVELIKKFIGRIRPENHLITVSNFSFPSGHTTFATIIALSIFFIYKDVYNKNLSKYLLSLVFLYPLIIAFSRVYLNVHWFSDVVGGLSLGVFIVTLNYLIFTYFLRKSKVTIINFIK